MCNVPERRDSHLMTVLHVQRRYTPTAIVLRTEVMDSGIVAFSYQLVTLTKNFKWAVWKHSVNTTTLAGVFLSILYGFKHIDIPFQWHFMNSCKAFVKE